MLGFCIYKINNRPVLRVFLPVFAALFIVFVPRTHGRFVATAHNKACQNQQGNEGDESFHFWFYLMAP